METTQQANEADIKQQQGAGWRVAFRILYTISMGVVPLLWYENRKLNAQITTDAKEHSRQMIQCEQEKSGQYNQGAKDQHDYDNIDYNELKERFYNFVDERYQKGL